MTSDKKRLNLSNKITIQQSDDIEKRRTTNDKEMLARHLRMYDKVRQTKVDVANRHNYLNDQTFKKGQSILHDVEERHQIADDRKNLSISKLKSR